MDKIEKGNKVREVLEEIRGEMIWAFFYDSEIVPTLSYYYNPNDECFHCDKVVLPFLFEGDEINKQTVSEALEELNLMVMKHFREVENIPLYEYD